MMLWCSKFGVLPICSKIDQEQGHAVSPRAELSCAYLDARFALQQCVVGVKHVGIANHKVKTFFPAVFRYNTGHLVCPGSMISATSDSSRISPPSSRNNFTSALHQRPGSAFRKIDTPLALQAVNNV